jgi:hypothetical protein
MDRLRRRVSGPCWTGRRRSGRAARSGDRSRLRPWSVHPRTREEGLGDRGHRQHPPRDRRGVRRGVSGATFVVGDVTDLAPADLGRFDFFFDVGCFQHLNAEQRLAEESGCRCACQPGCDAADARLPGDPYAFRRGWRDEGGGRGRMPGLGDALGRARGHHGAGVAADEDGAAVVPAPPKGLARKNVLSCRWSSDARLWIRAPLTLIPTVV